MRSEREKTPREGSELQRLLETEQTRCTRLKQQLKDQSAFISSLISQREQESQKRVTELTGTNSLRTLQSRVVNAIDVLSVRAASQARVRDKEIERLCNSQLDILRETEDIRREFCKQKAQSQTLSEQLTECKQELEAANCELDECRKTISELRSANSDLKLSREVLFRQLVALKKEQREKSLRLDSSPSSSPSRLLWARVSVTPEPTHDALKPRLDTVVSKLKSALKTEKRKLRETRSELTDEIQAKTELGAYLEDCIVGVKAEVAVMRERKVPDTMVELVERQKEMLVGIYRKAFEGKSDGRTET